jgi:hypothetical protein
VSAGRPEANTTEAGPPVPAPVAGLKPRPGAAHTEGGAVAGSELIAAPDATLVRVFGYCARAVRLPPGEGQVVWRAGHVVRG